MPDITQYKNISVETYNKLYTKTSNFKEQSILYLEKDLISLYQIIKSTNKSVYKEFGI